MPISFVFKSIWKSILRLMIWPSSGRSNLADFRGYCMIPCCCFHVTRFGGKFDFLSSWKRA